MKVMHSANRLFLRGFTLLEVMIASGVLFICLFAILGLLATALRNARALRRTPGDARTVAAFFAGTTNRIREGIESGSFSEIGDFSDRYRDFEWTKETIEHPLYSTNGVRLELYSVRRRSTGQIESSVERLVFDPQSKPRNPGIPR